MSPVKPTPMRPRAPPHAAAPTGTDSSDGDTPQPPFDTHAYTSEDQSVYVTARVCAHSAQDDAADAVGRPKPDRREGDAREVPIDLDARCKSEASERRRTGDGKPYCETSHDALRFVVRPPDRDADAAYLL